jgi:hypothetical protein
MAYPGQRHLLVRGLDLNRKQALVEGSASGVDGALSTAY